MDLSKKVLTYYDWDDIRVFLIKELKEHYTDEDRRYDILWSRWLSMHYNHIYNYTYIDSYFDMLIENAETAGDRIGPHLKAALQKLHEVVGGESITIYYSW